MLMFFLTTLGEWLEANAVALTVAVFSWLSSAAALIWVLSQIAATSKANGVKIDKLAKDLEDHADDLDKHKTDQSIHTTFEFRQSVQARFDRLQDEMTIGHGAIEAKIDRMTDRLLNNNHR